MTNTLTYTLKHTGNKPYLPDLYPADKGVEKAACYQNIAAVFDKANKVEEVIKNCTRGKWGIPKAGHQECNMHMYCGGFL